MPEAFGGSEKISGAMFSVKISAVCVLTTLRRLRMAFTPRTVSARCVASRGSEGTHGRAFKRQCALIDVDDDQIVGGQWARTHGFRDRGLQLHILGLFCCRLGEFVAHSHGAERYHSREDDDDDQEDSFKASVDHDRLGFARHELAPGNPLREGRIGTAASICINASDRPLRS